MIGYILLLVVAAGIGLILGFILRPRFSKDRLASPEAGQRFELDKVKEDLRFFHEMCNALPFPLWRRRQDLSVQYCNTFYSHLIEEKSDTSIEVADFDLSPVIKDLAKNAPAQAKAPLVIKGERKLFFFGEVPLPKHKGTVGYGFDISEQERLEQELARHISAHSDLLESSASAMAVFGKDTRLKYYNHAYTRLWGLGESWLDTNPTYSEVLEALRDKRELPEQANFPAFKQTQLKRFTDLISPLEEFMHLPDGKALRVIVIPHALGGLLFAYEDMTDKLALERSHNTLLAVKRASLDNLFEGIAVFGEDGRLQFCNPIFSKIWKISYEFLQSEPHISEILEACKPLYRYGGDWTGFKKSLLAEIVEGRAITSRVHERVDGSIIHTCHIPLPDGAVLVTCLDMTDTYQVERSLREKNEALEAADRLKTRFLASISYELRSPLTSIKGFAEMLKQEYAGHLNGKQAEYVTAILNSSGELKELIDSILDIVTIEAGYAQVSLETFTVQHLMQRASELRGPSEITFKLASQMEEAIFLTADQNRVLQMFQKLLHVAAELAGNYNLVNFSSLRQNDNSVCFLIECPVSQPAKQELIDVLSQVAESNVGPALMALGSGAMGIHLALAKSVALLHHASLNIYKTPEGCRIECLFPTANLSRLTAA